MRLSAKADYALRAAAELAAAAGEGPVKGERIAAAQEIPPKFLENILIALRHAGLVDSRRGADGGYRLARPASEIALADVIRAVDGPLVSVYGLRPEAVEYNETATVLQHVWIAARRSLRDVFEQVSIQQLADGRLPKAVTSRTADEDAWQPH